MLYYYIIIALSAKQSKAFKQDLVVFQLAITFIVQFIVTALRCFYRKKSIVCASIREFNQGIRKKIR